AVGAPFETVGTTEAAGAVSVFEGFGGGGGIVSPGPVFTQGSGGLGGTAESSDLFGLALE
ncbi:MAG TPA: VCBS repeat-containing protein, partial [Actinomycetota bacterium]|nr:VCBS repeat-containing protein [Actinomycetota bacterium]